MTFIDWLDNVGRWKRVFFSLTIGVLIIMIVNAPYIIADDIMAHYYCQVSKGTFYNCDWYYSHSLIHEKLRSGRKGSFIVAILSLYWIFKPKPKVKP
jgi:hypothetical protein